MIRRLRAGRGRRDRRPIRRGCAMAARAAAVGDLPGPTRNGKDFGMVRLRNALLAVMLAAGVVGCSHTHDYAHWSIFHCSECDDFPVPSYGPNSTPPGSYTGP